MPRDLDAGRVLAILEAHGVDFVLIGGFAGIYHGSPFPTQDIDITPDSLRDNLNRLSTALTELSARITTADVPEGLPFSHTGESLGAAGIWNLTTDAGELDISLVPSGTQGFDDLSRDAEAATIYGVTIRIASLADIIRSKQAANRPKDQRVLPTLRELLAAQPPRRRGAK